MQKIYYPEDKLPLQRLIPLGLQRVAAMFGATVLAVAMNLALSLGGAEDSQDAAECACDADAK